MDESRPSPVRRYSSRLQRLDQSLLTPRLQGARSYDRIAGYFTGSLLEVAGELLDSITGPIRVVCNSGLEARDVATARLAASALRQEWCASRPEERIDRGGEPARHRFSRLYQLLRSGKLQVRVLPDSVFGLVHGKAGVVTLADGRKTCFLGSVNESWRAWTLNYELVWEDESPEAVAWVQSEFDALWGHPAAVPLAEFVIEDIGRLSSRSVLPSVEGWKQRVAGQREADGEPPEAAVYVEAPVYRRQVGLWAHQKYFVRLAFEAHRNERGGARFVLADEVGLGKTVQLAMAAELMALVGDRPVLILAPKALVWQWRDELLELLDTPSAVWTGQCWVDEQDLKYPDYGPAGIQRCPRRIGIVPTSRIIHRCDDAEYLKTMQFECVVVDEAHNARRQNLGEGKDDEPAEPNNLLHFLYALSTRTRSMLLATATPVQLRPIEAWDLLDVLSRGSDSVLGDRWSRWRHGGRALRLIMGREPPPDDDIERWEWLRSPFPPRTEHRDFEILRRSLRLSDDCATAPGTAWDTLQEPDRQRIRRLFPRLITEHNPFIRHIVRRSRQFLEESIDPETQEPFLKRISVQLYGESDQDAIRLPPYLEDAYALAEEFCRQLSRRIKSAGFLKTLLLKRVGSTIEAGRITAERMLSSWNDLSLATVDADSEDDLDRLESPQSRCLTDSERTLLQRFVSTLRDNLERDPKYEVVRRCLREWNWLSRGCIIFSAYYDSIRWLADQLIRDFPGEKLAIYAGSGNSRMTCGGSLVPVDREEIKSLVRTGEIRLVLGTEAASEGLNLQRLGTLINLDLPWNPTRLEQRKGRIQRIGQVYDTIYIYNMRYLGSVEDRVHRLLSARLENIYELFGQIPDVLEDVWVAMAIGELERAEEILDNLPRQHPFEIRYKRITPIDWESCATVLSRVARRAEMSRGWA